MRNIHFHWNNYYITKHQCKTWQISLFNDLVWLFLWLDKSVMLQNLQFVKLYKFFITKFLFYFSFCICSLGNGWQLLSYSLLSRVARPSTSTDSSKKISGEEETEAQLLLLFSQHLPRRQLQLPPLQQLLLPQPRHWWLSWLRPHLTWESVPVLLLFIIQKWWVLLVQ